MTVINEGEWPPFELASAVVSDTGEAAVAGVDAFAAWVQGQLGRVYGEDRKSVV